MKRHTRREERELIRRLRREAIFPVDEAGRSLVTVRVRDEDSILSPFSADMPLISEEFAGVLEHGLTPAAIRRGIHLVVHCDTIDAEEQVLYESAIRSYYRAAFLEHYREKRRSRWIGAVLFAIGVLILTVAVILSVRGMNAVTVEILDIAAWVFLWEAVDLVLLHDMERHWERLKCLEMTRCVISYRL